MSKKEYDGSDSSEKLIRLEPNKEKKEEEAEQELERKTDENHKHSTSSKGVQNVVSKAKRMRKQQIDESSEIKSTHPVITKIQAQKRKGRYNIYLNEEYAFPVDEDLIVKHMLRKGMEISPDFESLLKDEDMFQKAYQKALHYLSYGLRSEKEVRDKLIEKEFENQVTDVVQKLKELYLINDEEYAKSYVRTAANLNRKGPRVIQNELKTRGIDELTIEEALPEYSFDDQVENAVILAEKQWKKTKKKSQREAVQKIKQHLMQKGFSTDVINHALESIDTEKETEEEFEALTFHGDKAWKRYAKKTEGYKLKQKTKAYLFNKGYSADLIRRFIEQKEEEV